MSNIAATPRDARSTIVTIGALAAGAYLFYTSYGFGADEPGAVLRLVRLSSGIVALVLLLVLNKRQWRVRIQFAIAAALSIVLPLVYAVTWEQTPASWIWVTSVFNNMLTFLAVWALWQYIVRRRNWLVATLGVAVSLLFLLVPSVRSAIALTVIAVMILPEKHPGRQSAPLDAR